ncbi:MAG: DNA primase DnaG [Candidatus ainarchaeum sp.]|nr:DNA primase DnaG [Candidatus ainarchaeum sp.]
MGKTYIDTVKYVVYAGLEIGGLVEKPDVVGAIFGQTEGLVGDELDLRELQKNGRIGRIEVELQARGGKSFGRILLPSSLDMVETSILAAALETVDRVGPCDATIKVEKIEDTRNVKRRQVVDRAKSLLKKLLTTEIPESKEISELVRQEVKTAEVGEYGPEKLPAGPNLTQQNSIVVVEGRADVINLLKNDIPNVVAVGGATVPKTIAELCREKETTVFLDGDRGGDIILRELSQACDIDFVARAPRGKEVEELTRKELIKCLRSRVPAEQVEGVMRERNAQNGNGGGERREYREQRPQRSQQQYRAPPAEQAVQAQPTLEQRIEGGAPQALPGEPQPPQAEPAQAAPEAQPAVPEEMKKGLAELENTLRARIYGADGALKSEVPVRDLIKTMQDSGGIGAVVLDGIITQRLLDLAESNGAKMLLGVKLGNIFRRPKGIAIYTKSA